MRKIVYTRPDGGISIVVPVINSHPVREQIAEEEAEMRAWRKLPKDAINPRFATDEEIPSDRTYRGAWQDTGTICCDMAKAREIHRSLMRLARAPKLQALDIEQLRGRDVEAQKQALRDVTADPRIDAATTPKELKAVWPECLK